MSQTLWHRPTRLYALSGLRKGDEHPIYIYTSVSSMAPFTSSFLEATGTKPLDMRLVRRIRTIQLTLRVESIAIL